MVLCTLTDNNVLQKISHQRNFPENFFRIISFSFQLLSSFFRYHWSFITKFSKSLLERIVFFEKKALFEKNFYFLSPKFCTPSHNNVKIIFLWKNTPESFFAKIWFFIFFHMFPHRWIIQNQSNLSEENKFQWFFFSPEYIFTFLSSVLCTPADNNVVRKKFMKNGFQKKYLFWENCFFFTIPV